MTESVPVPRRTLLRPAAHFTAGLAVTPASDGGGHGPGVDSEELIRRLDGIALAQPAAVSVLTLVDNANTTTPQLAAAIECDPTFTAQVMRLANSAYYGLSGRVGNTSFAITVVGFAAVRSLAAMNAAGLTGSNTVPDGFWAHAAAAAAGASAVASALGVVAADCFAAGLLHDVGIAFLHSLYPDRYPALLAEHGAHSDTLCDAERHEFGMSHAEVAAYVLETWRFPPQFVAAVRHHHGDVNDPFSRAVILGEALALSTVGANPHAETLLTDAGIVGAERDELIAYTAERAEEVLSSLPR
ncbi:MAG: HDOD domain-containing protein [Actinobacteria bacterium]|nr:HDOD domain-containing protein [Actinomycetota bacterium]